MRKLAGIAAAAGTLALLVGLGWAPEGSPAALPGQEEQPNKYLGAQQCRTCHRAEEKGNIYATWEQSRHAHALEALSTDRARELATARGIENPAEAPECRRCHVTAFGVPAEQLHRRFDPNAGVQCEGCHGPGERHQRARMAAAAQQTPVPWGTLGAETNVRVTEETCRGCHNQESPTFQEFNFRERRRAIRHRDPTRQGRPPDEEEGGNGGGGANDGCPDD